jgi:hypothetical protein
MERATGIPEWAFHFDGSHHACLIPKGQLSMPEDPNNVFKRREQSAARYAQTIDDVVVKFAAFWLHIITIRRTAGRADARAGQEEVGDGHPFDPERPARFRYLVAWMNQRDDVVLYNLGRETVAFRFDATSVRVHRWGSTGQHQLRLEVGWPFAELLPAWLEERLQQEIESRRPHVRLQLAATDPAAANAAVAAYHTATAERERWLDLLVATLEDPRIDRSEKLASLFRFFRVFPERMAMDERLIAPVVAITAAHDLEMSRFDQDEIPCIIATPPSGAYETRIARTLFSALALGTDGHNFMLILWNCANYPEADAALLDIAEQFNWATELPIGHLTHLAIDAVRDRDESSTRTRLAKLLRVDRHQRVRAATFAFWARQTWSDAFADLDACKNLLGPPTPRDVQDMAKILRDERHDMRLQALMWFQREGYSRAQLEAWGAAMRRKDEERMTLVLQLDAQHRTMPPQVLWDVLRWMHT